ncbi:YqjF family protein [Streptomyces sp. NPDC051109]|uniref:YqjF family protein n=1 Tax=Streptomyces sp. NPDC051109 TaxID=3365642 RepID=UPI0037AEBB47
MSVYWTRQAFVHWPYPPPVIQSLLPPQLEADVFEGQAWVSMTPFLMSRTRVLGVPMPWGTFPETNLRTYVRRRGGPSGLWFLALEVTHPAMLTARLLGVPYSLGHLVAEQHGGTRYYAGRRGRRGPRYELEVRTDERIRVARPLDSWLTDRFHAYSVSAGALWRTPVVHEPWPLSTGAVVRMEESLLSAAGLPEPADSPRVHLSPGVGPVRLGFPRRVA